MDVDTLLTRQMELHTSVRHPPKNPQGLVQLMDIMRNYKQYFESLRHLAERFHVEPETVFQAFMYISVGGAVNFDRQHQDGSVPMHQAKVLARSNAIELAPTLKKEIPNAELMVYVGLSRDLRTTLRVKVEDGNDLKTAEASVREAVEYLNYIDRCAHHNPEKLFAFYMAEDPNSLAALLSESDPLSMTQTMGSTTRDTLSSAAASGVGLPAVLDDGSPADVREPTPLPHPLSTFLVELRKQCNLASDTSSASGGATRRLKAAQILLDWVTAVPSEYFAEHTERIVAALSSVLSLLATEKRSALCRAGCDIITVLVQRLSQEPLFLDDVERGTCSMNPETFSGALAQWTASLAKGTYVTVAAISTAADAALRAVVIQSHGHICVVKQLIAVLAGGTQTELRRKCLGYLALAITAAHQRRPDCVRELLRLLAPVAVEYVSIGDSPSRKMARALCSVLRVLANDASPTIKSALVIRDERVEHLVQQERPQVEPAVRGGPRDLEELLFEADAFVSSTRSSFSASTPRNSSNNASLRGRGIGVGASGAGRGGAGSTEGAEGGRARLRGSGAPPLASRAPAAGGAGHGGVGGRGVGDKRGADEPSRALSPTAHRQQPPTTTAASPSLGEVRSPTRRAAPTSSNELKRKEPSSRKQSASVYDTDASLVTGTAPRRKSQVREEEQEVNYVVMPSQPTAANHNLHDRRSGSDGSSRGSAGQHQTPVLPPLVGAAAPPPRRGATPGLHDNVSEAPSVAAGRNGVEHHRTSSQPGLADRPVPLSLRENGSLGRAEGAGPGWAEPTGGPRMTGALRRKIEQNKETK